MKYDKFFLEAKNRGISDSQLIITSHYSLSFSIFDGELKDYEISDGSSCLARGIYNGKLGSVALDHYDNSKISSVISHIIEGASVIQNDDPVFIFEGSPKYHKFNVYNKHLGEVPTDEKIALTKKIYELISSADPRISNAEVAYSETVVDYSIFNSKGLKLTQKSNYFDISVEVFAEQGGVTKSAYEYVISNKIEDVNPEEFASKCVKSVLNQLGGVSVPTGTYKAILAPEVTAQFLDAWISHASSEAVQKGVSMWIDKTGTQVGSSKITVIDRPLARNVFGRYFDDEGVATYDKPIIKYGILNTYIYNLTTAAKAGVETTGNGYSAGGKTGVDFGFITLKPGRKTLDELMEKMGDGVYITDIEGPGLNAQNGAFSMQSAGFLVKNGKISKPLDLITISGNLFDLFKDVTDVGSELKLTAELSNGGEVPPVLVKKLLVGSE
ncbi:MAG: TldD/PmbA family protein [Coprobacillus sp.]|nr:TldD/PmbA family protein [Coprobacillus sp.]